MDIVSATRLSFLYVGLDTENHTISDLDDNLVFPLHVIQHREIEIIYTVNMQIHS